MGQKHSGFNNKDKNDKLKNKLSNFEKKNDNDDNKKKKKTKINDDGSIKNLKEPIENYDLIIYCNSFKSLFQKNGWYYKYSDNYKNFIENSNNLKCDSFCNISILGESNVGKTFILDKITNGKLSNAILKKTHGLSVKYFSIENKQIKLSHYFLYETEENFEPFINENIKEKNELKLKEKFKEYSNDLKLSKLLINKYLLFVSNVIIIVIGNMTFSAQEQIINFKNLIINKYFYKIIIIHNLQYYDKLQNIEEYIENTLKKSIHNKLYKHKFINEYDNKYYYFYEKDYK